MQIDIVPVGGDLLGESPVWDSRIQSLYWSDQLGRRIRRYTPSTGEQREWLVPMDLGCIALTGDVDKVLIALADGFYHYDLNSGACDCFVAVSQPRPGVRLNDGRCDRRGGLIAGSVTTDGGEAAGTVYHLGPDRTLTVLVAGLVIVNAICTSPAGNRIFYTDSRGGIIFVRDVDPVSGSIGTEREFADVRPHGGAPDGATVDANGGVWVAQIRGGRVFRFDANGQLDRTVQMPVPHVSSLAFGGAKLDRLYVTTIRETGMLIRSDHPDAGKLFVISGLGVRGVDEGIFGSGHANT